MIYLLRHGIDDERYVGGWSNVDLTHEGIKQIEEVGKFLKNSDYGIEKIYTSDIKRATTTADIIKRYLNKQVISTDQLRELNKGKLTGMEVNEAKQNYPNYFQEVTINTRYPDGESLSDLYKRTKLLLESSLLNQDKILLITHRGVINMVYTILGNQLLDTNKTKYNVTHASLHEFDCTKRLIRKIR